MALLSFEALTLVLVSVLTFKLRPKKQDMVHFSGNLLVILVTSAVVVCAKWWWTQSAQLSLFAVLFTAGALSVLVRNCVAMAIAAPFPIPTDPALIVVQLVLLAVGIITSMRSNTTIPINEALIYSNATILLLIGAVLLFFKPVFIQAQLMEATYFTEQSTKQIIESSFKGYRHTPKRQSWPILIARICAVGLCPFIIIVALGFVSLPVGSRAVLSLLLSVSAWHLIRNIPSCRTSPIRVFYLCSPYIWLTLATLMQALCLVYMTRAHASETTSVSADEVERLVEDGSYADAFFAIRSRQGGLAMLNILPTASVLDAWTTVLTHVFLLVISGQIVTSIGYRRIVKQIKKFSM